MKYLVTGGAGFIGSHIARGLLREGHEVAILDDLSNSTLENVPEGTTFVEGSVLDAEALREALDGCHGVFHLAAEVSVPKSMENPQFTMNVNGLGTLRLLKVMHEMDVKKIVFSGTSAVYGDQGETKNLEEMTPQTLSPYAFSKLQGEYFIKTFTHLFGFESVIFRYFNVYGPGQRPDSPYAAVIPIFCSRIREGKGITIFGDGTQTRDFIHVDDVVKANLLAMQSQLKGEVLNIGSGHSISLNDLVDLLKDSSPNSFEVVRSNPRAGDIWHSCANVEKAKLKLQFEAAVPFRDGLKKLFASK